MTAHGAPQALFKGRVYFGDTDAAGVVYHGRYVYWLEAARIELLEALGCPYTLFQADKIGFIPVHLEIDYHSPLKFSDTFIIHSELTDISKASFVVESLIKNASGQLICKAKVKLACLDETKWKPRPLPEVLLKKLKIQKLLYFGEDFSQKKYS